MVKKVLRPGLRNMSIKKSGTISFSTPDLDTHSTFSYGNGGLSLRKTLKKTTSVYSLKKSDTHSSILSLANKMKNMMETAATMAPCIINIAKVFNLTDKDRDLVFEMFNLYEYTPKEVSKELKNLLKEKQNENKTIMGYFALYVLAGLDLYHALKCLSNKIYLGIETDYVDMLIWYFAKEFHSQNHTFYPSVDIVKQILTALIAINTQGYIVGIKNVESVESFIARFSNVELDKDLAEEIEYCYNLITGRPIYLRKESIIRNDNSFNLIYTIDVTQQYNRYGDIFYIGYYLIDLKKHYNWKTILELSNHVKKRNSKLPLLLIICYKFYILGIRIDKCEKSLNNDEQTLFKMSKNFELPTSDFISSINFSKDSIHMIKFINARIPSTSILSRSFTLFSLSNPSSVDEYQFILPNNPNETEAREKDLRSFVNLISFLSSLFTIIWTKDGFEEFSNTLKDNLDLMDNDLLNFDENKHNVALDILYRVEERPSLLCMSCDYELDYKAKLYEKRSEALVNLSAEISDQAAKLDLSDKKFKRVNSLIKNYDKETVSVLMNNSSAFQYNASMLRKMKYPDKVTDKSNISHERR